MHHSTSWWVSGLFSTRRLGSSAASRPSACDSLSSSALLFATIATGSSGSGIDHGFSTRGSPIEDRVSPVSARLSLPIAQRSPATTAVAGTWVPPKGYDREPIFSSSSWSSWPLDVGEERREVTGHVDGVVGGEGAGEDADQADPADVLVAGGLHDLGDEHAPRVARDRFGLLAGGGEHLRRGVLQRRGEAVDGQVEQLGAADAAHRADRYDGVEARPGDGRLEVVGQGLVGDLLSPEVPVHQGLVLGLLDDALDQGAAEVFVLAVVGHQVDQPGHLAAAVAHRDVERQHLVAERRLGAGQYAVVVGARLVELGDHDGPRHADLGALTPQRGGGVVDRLARGDHEQRAVGRPQAGAHLAHEVGVPGGVDEVDLGVAVDDRGDGQRDGAFVGLLGVLEVADRRAFLDGPRSGDGSG